MNNEQTGQYIRLLCAQHQKGHLTESDVLVIVKDIDSPVMDKFQKDSKGKYYNKRMEEEIKRRDKYCNSRSHKGLSGRKKKNHTNIIRKSCDNHTETENENVIDINNAIKDEKKKHKHGEYFHVLLTDTEKEKLIEKLTEKGFNKWVKILDEGIELKGYKYKSHYLAILKWFNGENKKEDEKSKKERELEEWANE